MNCLQSATAIWLHLRLFEIAAQQVRSQKFAVEGWFGAPSAAKFSTFFKNNVILGLF